MIKPTPRWVVIWIILVLVISSLPYVVGWLFPPPDKTFSGVLLNVEDANSYLANLRLGADGKWLYSMPASAQANEPVPVFASYIWPGHLARLFGLSIPFIYHLIRVIFGGFFAWFSYQFIAHMLPDTTEQKFALAILLFTGGIGWFFVLVVDQKSSAYSTNLVLDLWFFQAIGFASILGFSHFTLSMGLMAWLLLSGQAFLSSNKWHYALQAIVASLGLALLHPQQLGIVVPVLALPPLLNAYRDPRLLFQLALRLGIMLLPATLLSFLIFIQINRDVYLSSWIEQSITYSPPLWAWFIMYGPMFVLALLGAWIVFRQREVGLYPVLLWFVVTALWLYAPVNFQARFVEGWHVPVAILASLAWYRQVVPRLPDSARLRTYATGLLFVTVLLSQVILLTVSFARLLWKDDRDIYISHDEQGALDWLNENTRFEDVLLASYPNGNRVTGRATIRTLLGQWGLTPFVDDRRRDVDEFFDEDTPAAERIDLLDRFGIDYVYYAEDEQALGEFAPEEADYLELVYDNPSVKIFRVATDP